MALRPEQLCEANIKYDKIQQSVDRIGYDFEGRRFDLGPDTIEQPGIEEVTISCEGCPFDTTTLRAEGKGPFGARNAISRQAKVFIEQNCVKFQNLKAEGAITEANREFNPSL
jgi:hypothetical protein